jgi:hypothetical protein
MKKRWNRISTENLEHQIMLLVAAKRFDAADAMKDLAIYMQAPINNDKIEKEAAEFRTFAVSNGFWTERQ